MQTQITRQCVMEEKTKELRGKPLRCPPNSNRSTRQSVGIHGLARDPPSSYSNKASWNHVLFSSSDPAIRSIASAKTWLLPILPSSTKTSLNTLKGCGKCLGCQPLNDMEMERQELRKIHKQFVQRIVSITISNSQGLWLGFSLRGTP